jgi:hypothetical protein
MIRIAQRLVVIFALLLANAWAVAAVWVDGAASRALAGALAGGVAVLTAGALALVRPWRRAMLMACLPFLAVLGWWLMLDASKHRDWQGDVARLPSATLEGPLLTVRNVRSFEYRDDGKVLERWETRTYNLD